MISASQVNGNRTTMKFAPLRAFEALLKRFLRIKDSLLSNFRSAILPLLGLKEETRSYRAPVIGDHVISHHQRWAYFPASIVAFDRQTMSYTVDWDDGDPTGKVQSYKVIKLCTTATLAFCSMLSSFYILLS